MKTFSSTVLFGAAIVASSLCSATAAAGLGRKYAAPPKDLSNPCSQSDCGSPVFLTPYLEQGRVQDAQDAAKVSSIGGRTSYSGFFTVDKAHNSNSFFWYFPPISAPADNAPVMVWLQGGPGGSSLFGVFNEAGPFRLSKSFQLSDNPHTWNKDNHMIFIDNPVGTGFSFTDPDGYCTNKECYGNALYEAITQFFTMFPQFSSNDFYIAGESYAGKYVPMFGYTIHTNNAIVTKETNMRGVAAALKQQHPFARFVNLKGLSIGDGWCDPPTMIPAYGDLMFNYGLVDGDQKRVVDDMVSHMSQYIEKGDFLQAYTIWDAMLNGDLTHYPTFWQNATGGTDYFNILRDASPASFNYFSSYVNQADVRKAIHVGSKVFHSGSKVEYHLMTDVMQTVKPELAVLMTNYKVLIYSGQLDVIIGGALTERFLPTVDWPGKYKYSIAERHIWHVDGKIAGYVRSVMNFTQAIVRGGGHILPYDQPARSLDMLERFINDEPFN